MKDKNVKKIKQNNENEKVKKKGKRKTKMLKKNEENVFFLTKKTCFFLLFTFHFENMHCIVSLYAFIFLLSSSSSIFTFLFCLLSRYRDLFFFHYFHLDSFFFRNDSFGKAHPKCMHSFVPSVTFLQVNTVTSKW